MTPEDVYALVLIAIRMLAVLCTLVVLQIVLKAIETVRTHRVLSRTEKLLTWAEMHGAITDANKQRTEILADKAVEALEATKEAAKKVPSSGVHSQL